MALILAIEPDRRQAAQLTDLVRTRVKAELVLADTTEGAFGAIGNRVPDLVLVPTLLSPQDDAALAGALRVIATAARVQMLTIPVLADCAAPPKPSGLLSRWRRRSATPTPTGCDPSVFADQIAAYLAEGAAERETEIDDVDGEPAITESIEQAPPPIEEPLVAHLDTIVVASILEPVATQIEEPAATSLEELVSASIEEPITRAVEETIVRAVEEPVIGVVKEPVIRVVEEPIIRVAEQPAAYAPEQTAYRSFEQPVVQTLSESVVPAIEDAPIEEPALAAHALAEVAAAEPATTVMAESTVLPVEDPDRKSVV